MYRSKKFEGKLVFPRDKGCVLTEISLPKELEDRTHLDFDINKDNRKITFIQSVHTGSPYIIADVFGVCEETQINCFFIKGGVVIELIVGKIYIKDENDVIHVINDNGGTQLVATGIEKISWVNYSEYIRHNLRVMVAYKYNIPEANTYLIDEYINNLACTLTLEARNGGCKDSNYLRMKVVQYFTDLGIGVFEFKVLESEEIGVMNYTPKSDVVVESAIVTPENSEDDSNYEDDDADAVEESEGGTGCKKSPKTFSDEDGLDEDSY